MSNVKQVIVLRKDLKMRRGKECSQAAHAAMAWLVKRMGVVPWASEVGPGFHIQGYVDDYSFKDYELEWLGGIFTKVCVQVGGLSELEKIVADAKAAGLEAHTIVDVGTTEFHGVPTVTCAAIGPDLAEKIDPITGHLKLY